MDQIQAVELLIQSQAEQIRQLTEANAKLSEQLTGMQQRMDKLLAQIAWFTRQFYGRKRRNSRTWIRPSSPCLKRLQTKRKGLPRSKRPVLLPRSR